MGSGAVKVAGYLPCRQNGLNLSLSRFSPTHSVFSFRIFFCLFLLPVVPTAEARIGLALPYDPPSGYYAAVGALLGEGLKGAWQSRDHSPGDFAEASRRKPRGSFPARSQGLGAAMRNPVGSPPKPPAKRTSCGGKISLWRSIEL